MSGNTDEQKKLVDLLAKIDQSLDKINQKIAIVKALEEKDQIELFTLLKIIKERVEQL